MSTTGLGDDALQLIDLLLGTAKGTELFRGRIRVSLGCACPARMENAHTLFLASLRARLSLELRSNSMTRRS